MWRGSNVELNLSGNFQEHICDPILGFSSTSANCRKVGLWLGNVAHIKKI